LSARAYDAHVTTPEYQIEPKTTDAILRHLIDHVESDPSQSVPMTLYLPWGAATGELASRRHFQQYVGDHLNEQNPTGDLGDYLMSVEMQPVAERANYVHLREARCLLTKGLVVGPHGVLRILLAEITAWALGEMWPLATSITPSEEVP
jgi:hypothetical protein